MDDAGVMLDHPQIDLLLCKLQAAFSCVGRVCSKHGLWLNTKRGKTELVAADSDIEALIGALTNAVTRSDGFLKEMQ